MRRIQAGEHGAYSELCGRFEPQAYRTAFSICRDRDAALDAVQDAFLSIWTSSATYQPQRGPVLAWAMTIVRHRAIYIARRRSALAERTSMIVGLLDSEPAADDLVSELAVRTQHEELVELVRKLPTAQQEVIRLGFFDGLSHREIAQSLGLPPGTVKGRIRLGLNKLRSELVG